MMTEQLAKRLEYDAEQLSIADLVATLPRLQADAARQAIQRTLDQAREWARLHGEFRRIAAVLDTLEPCERLMGKLTDGGHASSSCRWCELLEREQTLTRRIDDIRRMLGILP